MRTIRHTLYYPSRSNLFTLYHMTDVHMGHAACDEDMLKRDIEAIKNNPRAYWGGGGDYGDFITRKGDKRYRETTIAPWLRGKNDVCGRQVERLVELFGPIADKCLYLLKGNHEDSVLSYYDRDVYLEFARGIAQAAGKEIRDLALGWEGFIVLKFRRGKEGKGNYGGTSRVVIYAHHGAGGGRKQGGHALRMEETLLTYQSDLVLLGHRHIRQQVTKDVIAPSGKSIKYHNRVGVWCGSYLGSYIPPDETGFPADNYPQFKQLSPTTAGIVPVIIKPDVRRVMPIVTNGCASDLLSTMTMENAA